MAPGDRLLRLTDLGDAPAGIDSARACIEGYTPGGSEQAAEVSRVAALAAAKADALWRTCAPAHITGSAAVLDPSGRFALLLMHRKLRRWLQPGGHADGDGLLARVALREATEESGLAGLRVDPRPIDVDVHAVPCPPGERGFHHDVRFLVVAAERLEPPGNEESLEVRWFPVDDLPVGPDGLDAGGRRLIDVARARLAALLRAEG